MVLAARWRGRATVAEACRRRRSITACARNRSARPRRSRSSRASSASSIARCAGPAASRRPACRRPRGWRAIACLPRSAREVGAGHVLTAHTLDDQAETDPVPHGARQRRQRARRHVDRFDGCRSEEGRDLGLVRPLLGIPKSRLIATLKAAKIRYADDPSNRDPRFTRSRFRELMPVLAREGLTASRLARCWPAACSASKMRCCEVDGRTPTRGSSPGPWPDDGPVTMRARTCLPTCRDEIAMRLLGRAIAWTGDEGPVELGKLEALLRMRCVARR